MQVSVEDKSVLTIPGKTSGQKRKRTSTFELEEPTLGAPATPEVGQAANKSQVSPGIQGMLDSMSGELNSAERRKRLMRAIEKKVEGKGWLPSHIAFSDSFWSPLYSFLLSCSVHFVNLAGNTVSFFFFFFLPRHLGCLSSTFPLSLCHGLHSQNCTFLSMLLESCPRLMDLIIQFGFSTMLKVEEQRTCSTVQNRNEM